MGRRKKAKGPPESGWMPSMKTNCTHLTYWENPPPALCQELRKIAQTLVIPGKGIMACDETAGTMGKRLQDVGLENTEWNRKKYRQLLFGTDGLSEFVSGITLFHETVYQRNEQNDKFITMLEKRGIIPGVRVDKGVVVIYTTDEECTTQGLEDLAFRCNKYKKEGCHFTKWRCVLKIWRFCPSQQAINDNANVLARFASISQSERMVPVLQIDILNEGDHDLDLAQKTHEKVMAAVVKALIDHHVYLEGIVLSPNMVTAGIGTRKTYTIMDVARATLTALNRTVPVAIPGITFNAGTMFEEDASVQLSMINSIVGYKRPWSLSFNFGRAMQMNALQTWEGLPENEPAAKLQLMKRAKANGQASLGKYVAGSALK